MAQTLKVPMQRVRRLALRKQGLAGRRPPATSEGVLEIARKIRCIQIDPIDAVARTQYLVPFSRLGPRFRPEHLDEVVWERKEMFPYWAHAASLVLTEDFPIHVRRMRRWPDGDGPYAERTKRWMQDNARMKRYILGRIRKDGPLRSRDLTVTEAVPWSSTGWNAGQDVTRMLEFLWIQGKLTIAGRSGGDRVWDLADRWFPEWTPRERLTERQAVERSVRYALRALGAATRRDISQYFTRGNYPELSRVLERLVRAGEIATLDVENTRGPWYALAEDVALLERDRGNDGTLRTTLLSPFDNLIADRARTKRLFDFDYTIEIYVAKEKRRFGYYVLPILHGDRLIGRIDSRMDRKANVYRVNHIYAEPDAPRDRATGVAVKRAIEEMASWLKATGVRLGTTDAWERSLG